MNHSTAPPAADGYVPDVQVVQGDEPFASEAENAVKHGATTRHATAAHRSACTASSSSRSSLCDDGRSVPGRASGSRARVARRDGRGRLPSGHRNSWGTEYSLPDQGARTPPRMITLPTRARKTGRRACAASVATTNYSRCCKIPAQTRAACAAGGAR